MKKISFFIVSIAILSSVYLFQTPIANSEPSSAASESEKLAVSSTWSEQNPEFQKPARKQLKKMLSPLQYEVTQQEGTEQPFQNKYWNNKQPGIYVDVVSGEPLFSSTDKFKSGTGWPSFTRPISSDHIVHHEDRKFFVLRTELRSKYADSHLGHVFDDGPAPTGLRYCINSAALKFIPVNQLESEGYAEYKKLFE